MNIVSLTGLSISATRANNIQGIATWPGGANNSNAIVFGTPEADTNYEIHTPLNNTAALDGVTLRVATKTVNGFTLYAVGTLPVAGTQAGWFLTRVTTAHT